MYKKYKTIVLLVIFVLTLSGCFYSNNPFSDNPGYNQSIEIDEFRVYFVIDGKTTNYKIVTNNQIFSPIEAPQKENQDFIGWFFDDGTEYKFDKPLEKETYLYAKYEPDFAKLINKVSTEIMKANVKITATSYNSFLGIPTSSITSQGSGIIFFEWESQGYYAVLTNSHVAHKKDGYDKVKYEIEDYKGNTYSAIQYYSTIDISYDLAILQFKKENEDLLSIPLTRKNSIIGDYIITIGQPEGQNNTITFGKVLQYKKITLSDSTYSDVDFEVMEHDSPSAKGSSGGAILNSNLELVGLQYAGSIDSQDNFITGYGIPIEKIQEFLSEYFYNK